MIEITYLGTSSFNNHPNRRPIVYTLPDGDRDDVSLCEQAFTIFNAPEEVLSPEERYIATFRRGSYMTSMSIGDTVQIEDHNGIRRYRCGSMGWDRVES